MLVAPIVLRAAAIISREIIIVYSKWKIKRHKAEPQREERNRWVELRGRYREHIYLYTCVCVQFIFYSLWFKHLSVFLSFPKGGFISPPVFFLPHRLLSVWNFSWELSVQRRKEPSLIDWLREDGGRRSGDRVMQSKQRENVLSVRLVTRLRRKLSHCAAGSFFHTSTLHPTTMDIISDLQK